MNELEKHLIFVYTTIAIVLIISLLVVLLRKELLKWPLAMWLFVILFIFPIGCIGLFFMFVTIYSFAEAIIKDDFVLIQIITNAFNITLVYWIFSNIKRRK